MIPLSEEIKDASILLAGIVASLLWVWRNVAKTRLATATDETERKRIADAFQASIDARENAERVASEMMLMQRRMGRLEAENEAGAKRADELAEQLKELREDNRRLHNQMSALLKP